MNDKPHRAMWMSVVIVLCASGMVAAPARAETPRGPRMLRPLSRSPEPAARATASEAPAPSAPSGPSTSWQGVNDLTTTPSDSTGAIGPTRYVELVNSVYGIYDRTGSALQTGPFETLTGDPSGTSLCDPQVIWDPSTERFYYVILLCEEVVSQTLRYGFSKTDSPGGAADWCNYTLDYGYGTLLPDYPKLGDTENFLMIGANIFDGFTGPFVRTDLAWLKKPPAGTTCPATLTQGLATDLREADNSQATTIVPANQTDGDTTGYAMSARDPAIGSANVLTVFTVTENGSTLDVDTSGTSVTVGSFAYPPNAPQTGTTVVLDTLDARLTQAVSAIDPSNGNKVGFWTQHTVAVGGRAAVRWYEVDPAVASVLGSGTVSDPSLHIFNGAIAPDRANDGATAAFGDSMVLGFNTSSSTTYPAIQMVWKTPSALSSRTLVKQSPGYNRDFSCSPCRWGDYAGASPDPAADQTGAHGTVWQTNAWNVASTNSSNVDWRSWNWSTSPGDTTIQFNPSSYTVEEGDGMATITATRTGDTDPVFTVDYATSEGTAMAGSDYTTAMGTLTFGTGETSATFDVPILDDSDFEPPPNETVLLTLSNPSSPSMLGAPSVATLQIIDNEPSIHLSASSYAVAESAASRLITVVRNGDTSGTDVVSLDTQGVGVAPATAGVDYQEPEDVTFDPGEPIETFTVPILQDTLFEGNETFSTSLSVVSGNAVPVTPSTATVTIGDDDTKPTLKVAASTYSTLENVSPLVVTVTRSGAPDNEVSVSYVTTSGTATAGSDFTSVSGMADFAPGVMSVPISIPVTNDALKEHAETFTLTLSTPLPDAEAQLGSPSSAVITILKSDQQPDGLIRLSTDTAYKGNNIYNTTAGQWRLTGAPRSAKRIFYVRIQNDGTNRNTFKVSGPRSGTGYRVQYYAGTGPKNIGTAIVTGTYSAQLTPGATAIIRIEITLASTAVIGSTKSVLVTGTWTGDGVRTDAVKASVRVV